MTFTAEEIRDYIEETCVRETQRREQLAPVRISQLPGHMPAMLTWTEEPGARNGDEFVFVWKKSHQTIDGVLHSIDIPHVYIRLTSNPKRRRTLKGYEWRASYCWCNMEEYLAPGAGTTTSQSRSIDPDHPVAPVDPKGPEVERAEATVRNLKRLESDMEKAPGPGAKARIRNEMRRAA